MKRIIQIEFLKDCPQFMSEVAYLWHQEWSQQPDKTALERQVLSVQAKANKGRVPFILVAITDGELAGTTSVFNDDLENRPELTPWLAAVVTRTEYRGLGVAEQLIASAASECKTLGYDRMYLRTEKADAYFDRLGWGLLADTVDEHGVPTRVFTKVLPSPDK